jgi:hypothetical protein
MESMTIDAFLVPICTAKEMNELSNIWARSVIWSLECKTTCGQSLVIESSVTPDPLFNDIGVPMSLEQTLLPWQIKGNRTVLGNRTVTSKVDLR